MTVASTLAYYKSLNQPKWIVGQFESYIFVSIKNFFKLFNEQINR
jgi:hypothetical protein